jgi:hypothetical protein
MGSEFRVPRSSSNSNSSSIVCFRCSGA